MAHSSSTLAVYPGSFDPVTNGHLDVIERAARMFDHVVIAVAANDQKTATFPVDQRVALIREAVAKTLPGVEVVGFDGLLVNFARERGATALVRGLRAISDFEFEFQMALMNRKLAPEIETIFLMPAEECTYISSRIVKEIARLGGSISGFVPPCVESALLDICAGGER